MIRTSFSLLLLIIVQAFSWAQTGIISGIITDSVSGEILPATNVVIPGSGLGAQTNFDGLYIIYNLKPGTYTLKISFISYETRIIEGVQVKANDTTRLNIKLQRSSKILGAMVVSARQRNQTESAMLKHMLKSASLSDGISTEQFSRIGAGDAASALKRVTGLSVEGGKYVYVRGLGERYSVVLLNGSEVPGLDPNRNTVQMDLFPTEIIENIVVQKTFTPEVPGHATGGSVDIKTRDFPDSRIFALSFGGGYNLQSTFNPEFITYKGGKLDFLGIDDGTRNLPEKAQQAFPGLFQNNALLDDITKSFNRNWDFSRKGAAPDHNFSIAYGNQFKLAGRNLGFLATFSYDRDYSYYSGGINGRYRLSGSNATQLNELFYLYDEKGVMEVLMGGLINLSYQINSNNTLSFNYIHNMSGEKMARYQYGIKRSDDPNMHYETRTLQFLERGMSSSQLRGKHTLPKLGMLEVDWISSYTLSTQLQPDLRFFTNDYYISSANDTTYNIQIAMYPVPSRYYRDMSETNWSNKIDMTYPFKLLGSKSKISAGGSVVMKNRAFSEKRISFIDQNDSYNGIIADYFDDANTGEDAGGVYGVYVQNSEEDDLKNSYDASQFSASAYISADMPSFGRWRLNPGLRFERTLVEVASRNPNKAKGSLDETDLLPSVNLTYSLAEKSNLRFAYTRTVARPSFRELAPYASFDFIGSEVIVGNPDLQSTHINNLDFRYEKFAGLGELLAVSAFYKHFTNPIERTFNPEAANPELTWRNVPSAWLLGVEMELRKELGFISPRLKLFSFSGNVTFVKSLVFIDERELEIIRVSEPEHPEERVMSGQSPVILNAMLTYNNSKKGWESNLSYNVSGSRLSIVMIGGTPNIYELPFHSLNFNVTKKLGDHAKLKFSVNNILNAENRYVYSRYDENGTFKGEVYNYQLYQTGRVLNLGISWKL